MIAAACMVGSGPTWVLACVTLTIASVLDIRSRRIPNWLTAGAFVAGLVTAHTQNVLSGALVAALLSVMVMVLPNLHRPGAIGAGDVKLVGAMGALLGVAGALLVVGVAACGVLGVTAPFRRPCRTRYRQTPIPFAPFLLAGFVISGWVCDWIN